MPRITLLFVATTAVAAIVATHLWQQLHSERQKTAWLQDSVARLELEVARKEMASASIATAPIQVAVNLPAAQAGESATAEDALPQAVTAPQASRLPSINSRDLLKDPEYREALLAQLRRQLPRAYPDLAQELALTPEQASALFDLLASQQVESTANSIGVDDSEDGRQEMLRAQTERARAQQDELAAHLGPARYQQYREYQQTLSVRRQVDELRTTLAATAYPLTEEQKSPLLASLIAEQPRQVREVRPLGRNPTDPRTRLELAQEGLRAAEERNLRVLEAAQFYLSRDQLAVLRGSMDQQLSISRASLRAQQAQLEAEALR